MMEEPAFYRMPAWEKFLDELNDAVCGASKGKPDFLVAAALMELADDWTVGVMTDVHCNPGREHLLEWLRYALSKLNSGIVSFLVTPFTSKPPSERDRHVN